MVRRVERNPVSPGGVGTGMKRPLIVLTLVTSACSIGTSATDGPERLATEQPPPAYVALPTVDVAPTVTFVGAEHDFATVDASSGEVVHARRDWTTRISLDRTYAVSAVTVGPGDTKIAWDSLTTDPEPVIGGTVIDGIELEPTATQLDGHLAAFVTPATPVEGAIAGSRTTSTIVVAGPEGGERWRTVLDGNFEPEAFGRHLGADGLPTRLFLLEYFPAESPRFYRVRVLSTSTGEVSLPLDLRNKSDVVDERMAGFSRDQLVAHDHGLLFTLYRGTIDGTPDGEPYGFVHTLDFADGVWCLSIDPALDLDTLDGTIAVSEDRLYVASSNGTVGSFDIPSISDPNRSPTMTWVTKVSFGGDTAPVMIADGDGVLVGYGDDQLIRVLADGTIGLPTTLPAAGPTALARDADEVLHAFGDGWSTLDLSPPAWLGPVIDVVIKGDER